MAAAWVAAAGRSASSSAPAAFAAVFSPAPAADSGKGRSPRGVRGAGVAAGRVSRAGA